MADAPVVHIGENSPEEVALKLTQIIASVEKRSLAGHVANTADRKWLLDTYAAVSYTHQTLPTNSRV